MIIWLVYSINQLIHSFTHRFIRSSINPIHTNSNPTNSQDNSKNGPTIYLTRSRCFYLGGQLQTCCHRQWHVLGQAFHRYQCRANRTGHVPFTSYQAIYRYVFPLSPRILRLTIQLPRSRDLPSPMTRTLLLGMFSPVLLQ